MQLRLQVVNRKGAVQAQSDGTGQSMLVYPCTYRVGDAIVISTDTPSCFLVIRLEDSMPSAIVYMAGDYQSTPIPFGEKRACYSPKSFVGDVHLLTARAATRQEISRYRNLAFNPYDCHENQRLYPHAAANVETRGESVFAARNAIDGVTANRGHGLWPYQSWGINQNPDAEMRVEFGRDVRIDQAVLTTRADFPHDAWWVKGTLAFSDGGEVSFPLAKTALPQTVQFPPRVVQWVMLKNLIKADIPSPFPALSQLEIWGMEEGCKIDTD